MNNISTQYDTGKIIYDICRTTVTWNSNLETQYEKLSILQDFLSMLFHYREESHTKLPKQEHLLFSMCVIHKLCNMNIYFQYKSILIDKNTCIILQKLCELADETTGDENILVVTHGAWLMCFIDMLWEGQKNYNFYLEEWDPKWLKASPINTCTTRFTIQRKANNDEGDGKGPGESYRRKVRFHHAFDTTHLPTGL